MSEKDGSAENSPSDVTSETWPLLRHLFRLAWRYRAGCIKVLVLQIVLLLLGLSGLSLTGLGVDYIRYYLAAPGTAKLPRWPFGLTPNPDWAPMAVIGSIAGAILLFALVRSALNIAYTLALNRLVQSQIVVDLRAAIYDKMQRLSFRFFDANTSSSLINRVTGDVQSVRMFVDAVLMQSVILVLSLIIYFVYMVNIHPWLTFACLASTTLLWLLTSRFSRSVHPAYQKSRELFDRLIQILSESVQGVQVVKGFAREPQIIARFAEANRQVRDQKSWIFRQVSAFQPLINLITNLNLVVMLGYGGYLIIRHELAPAASVSAGISIGQLIVFAGLLQQFSGQVANIANIANSMQQSLIGAKRVFEIMDTPVEIHSSPDAVRIPRARGAVEFDHVCFAYEPSELVLNDVTFKVQPGECVAILGPTGSGKSTLLSLIPRFYDVTSGRVLVDGIDVRKWNLDDLRRNIGLVFQESFLFSNTVAANIAFGQPNATREQIEHAAAIAAADEFIRQLPNGYDTILREGGSDLSGGQRQRLAIARALLLEPAILLLDDPTAAVDPETENEILEAIERAMSGRTTFIVTHRISALRRADRIIVLNRGRIVQSGAHEELMAKKGDYLWAARLQIPDAESMRLLGLVNGDTLKL